MGGSNNDRPFLDDLESALQGETGPDMKGVASVLDRIVRQIHSPKEASLVAEDVFGVSKAPWTALAYGMFWSRVGHWIWARRMLETQTAQKKAIGEPLEGFAQLYLAQCQYKLRRLEATRSSLGQAKYMAEKTGHAQLKALSLALEATLAFKELRLEEAQSRLEEAQRALPPERAWSIPAMLADIQGRIELYRGQTGKARKAFEKAGDLAHAANDSRAQSAVLRHITRLHLLTENREHAQKTINTGMEITRQARDWFGEAAFLAMEGDLLRSDKKYDIAERKYQEAMKINEALENDPGRAVCAIALANNSLAQGMHDKARAFLNDAMQMSDAMNIPSHRADAVLAYARLGETAGAQDTENRYDELVKLFTASPRGFRYAHAIFNYGRYMVKKGKIEQAAQLLAEAYEKAAPLEAPSFLEKIRDLLESIPSKEWASLYQRLRVQSSELTTAKETLQSMIRQREGATATLVHDLKNRLAPLLMSLSIAKEKGIQLLYNEKDLVPPLLVNAKALDTRLKSLTEYWKSEMVGVMKPNLANIDMNEIFANMNLVGKLLMLRDIKWTFKPPDSLPEITCDAEQIERVFENLIFNAYSYTQRVHSAVRYVTVEAEWNEESKEFRASVTNSGPTIPADKLREIFKRYVQVSYEDKDEVKKSIFNEAHVGLGLYYCDQVVAAHGGRIWAENLQDGSGVKFTFVLPLRPPSSERKIFCDK